MSEDRETVDVTNEKSQQEKSARNAAYLRMLQKSAEDLEKGNFVVRTMEELESYEFF